MNDHSINNSNTPSPTTLKRPRVGGFGMGRGPGGIGGKVEKAKNFKGTMRTLISYLKPYWGLLFVVLVFAIASTVFSIISPKILGNMTNDIVTGYINMTVYDQVVKQFPAGMNIPAGTTGADIIKKIPPAMLEKIPADRLDQIKTLDLSKRPEIDFQAIGNVAMILIGLFLLSALFSFVQGWIMTGVTQKVTYQLRENISKKINLLPLKYFDSRTIGDVLSRVTNDVDSISQNLNQSMSQIVTSLTTVVGILIMMLSISWQMTLIALLVLPVSFAFIAFVVKRSQKYFSTQQDSLGRINGHIEEMYSGHNLVKVFNGEKRALEKFKIINQKLNDSAWKSQFFSGLMWPIMGFIGNLGYVGVAVVGGYLAVKKVVNIGDIQAFIQYIRSFNQPIIQSAQTANVLQSIAAAAERVFEFLNEQEEVPDIAETIELKNIKGDVEFNNVIFGYNSEKNVIKGFNAKIKSGQRVAIVGPTGTGKTTIVNLLMRFYDVTNGSIKVDGIDIRKVKRAELRRSFGMVLQDTWLFNGTIKENICYGKLNASDDEMIQASKAAHVDHFVRSLPNSYAMKINEEADNISQGEKQLLTIARAMLAKPPILILDEATSSVDTRTEVLIQKAMENLMKNRTSFVIAHRLSTIRYADLILVMRDGNIVEQGTHVQLLAKNGFYSTLYNSQFSD